MLTVNFYPFVMYSEITDLREKHLKVNIILTSCFTVIWLNFQSTYISKLESWAFENNKVEMWNGICIIFLLENVTVDSMTKKSKSFILLRLKCGQFKLMTSSWSDSGTNLMPFLQLWDPYGFYPMLCWETGFPCRRFSLS